MIKRIIFSLLLLLLFTKSLAAEDAKGERESEIKAEELKELARLKGKYEKT